MEYITILCVETFTALLKLFGCISDDFENRITM